MIIDFWGGGWFPVACSVWSVYSGKGWEIHNFQRIVRFPSCFFSSARFLLILLLLLFISSRRESRGAPRSSSSVRQGHRISSPLGADLAHAATAVRTIRALHIRHPSRHNRCPGLTDTAERTIRVGGPYRPVTSSFSHRSRKNNFRRRQIEKINSQIQLFIVKQISGVLATRRVRYSCLYNLRILCKNKN